MKKKLKFINLLLPLIVLFAILFPAIHSYEHIHNHNSNHKNTELHHTAKTEFKIHKHTEECAICHFKFSPVTPFAFEAFTFYKNNTITSFVVFYSKSYSNFFKGALFSLRAPPRI
ncbi:hypothetical protein L1276_000633 [Flavobacterium sp. HSC-32F16]|uniref:hypothetical protein n=1 Tax=Flavobacterium sp. HSC-32F16 TaxID=2910964 RepID=UPI0020A2A574|nr:hypothetical protein [Flavobacterium sp. HSC-32F16]MCP2025493.1 hypothetical protein [Flavobacterium sp. HSC-32F16]